MALPFAIATFCVTAAVCNEKRKGLSKDQFVGNSDCVLLVPDGPAEFAVGAVDMSHFITSSIASMPSVKAVSVKADADHVQVEVTVDEFEWKNLGPIYEKEMDLSLIFRDQALEFRVIDDSPFTRKAVSSN